MNDSQTNSHDPDEILARFLAELETADDREAVLQRYLAAHPSRAAEFRDFHQMHGRLESASALANLPVPDRLGDFEIVRLIRRGGNGEIYQARQLSLNRRVAVKIIRRDRSHPRAKERFRRERQVLARLHQTNVVPVFAAGEERFGEELLEYFAMPYIDGVALDHVVDAARRFPDTRRGSDTPSLGELAEGESTHASAEVPTLSFHNRSRQNTEDPSEVQRQDDRPETHRPRLMLSRRYIASVVDCVEKIARAVEHFNAHGIVHRDLKPSNIMINAEGECWVIDFGLSVVLPDGKGPAGTTPTSGAPPPSTNETEHAGTPNYMSPEQFGCHQGSIDCRTDVWGAGAILYTLLTFEPPVEQAETMLGDLRVGRPVTFVAPRQPGQLVPRLPLDLQAICSKCLETEPARRYGSAGELAEELSRFQRNEPIAARPVGMVERSIKWMRRQPAVAGLIAVGLLLVLGGVAFAGFFAVTQKQNARIAREHADQILARKRTGDRQLYAAGTNLAQRARNQLQTTRALQLLDSLRPEHNDGGLDYRGWEWHYLKRLCHSEKLRLQGHAATVGCITYSPDGKLIASGSRDGTARVWKAETGAPLQVLRGHLLAVTCVAFSSDNLILATGSDDASVKLWDVPTGKELASLNGHVLQVNSVAFDRQGKLLATGAADNSIQLYDVASRKRVRMLEGNGGDVYCVTFSPDGKLLGSAGNDHQMPTIRLWDIASGEILKVFHGNSGYLRFTPDGTQIVFGGVRDLRFADVAKGEIVRTIPHKSQLEPPMVLAAQTDTMTDGRSITYFVRPSGGFRDATLTPDGKQVTTVDNGLVQFLDMQTGKEVGSFVGDGDQIAFNPDGREIATSGGDHFVRIWSMATDSERITLKGHQNRVVRLAFSPDGKRLASVSEDQSAKIWDAVSGKELANLGHHEYLFSEPTDGQLPALEKLTTWTGHTATIHDVAYSPDGCWLASASHDKTLRVWETETAKEKVFQTLSQAVTSVAWSPDGKLLAAGSWDDRVHLFDFPSGKHRREFSGHERDVTRIAFFKNGRLLASAGRDETIRIWEVDSGKELKVLRSPSFGLLTSIAVSQNGQLLAAAGDGTVITLFDTTTWNEVYTMWGHSSRIDDLVFSPDGGRLVSASGRREDGTVKVWDTTTGLELLSLPGAYAVTFSPDGKRLAVGMRPHEIVIYDSAPIDDQPYRIAAYEAPSESIQSSDDGRLRVLGFFTAGHLRGCLGAPRVMKPTQEGHEFLVAVASLPHGQFIPTEQEYAELIEEDKKAGEGPTPSRDNISLYSPNRFQLILPTGESVPGKLIGIWPATYSQPGFNTRITSGASARNDPHQRWALAIAWSIDPKAIQGPLSIRADQAEPVAMPEIRLLPDRRLVATEVDLLDYQVELAYQAVQQGAYADAVAAAAAAAADSQSTADTIYNAACVHAVAVARAEQDFTLADVERKGLCERYAVTAVTLLRQAVAKGFDSMDHFKNDPDLGSLRHRLDFRTLFLELEKKLKPTSAPVALVAPR